MTSLRTFQVFPGHWDWRRVMEFGVTAYQATVGAVAFVHPASMQHSSYTALIEMMPADDWGLSLWTIALLHALAIRFDGKSPVITAVARTIACASHLFVLLLIGICYVQVGDYYRIVTTIFLIMAILAACSIATEDVARIIRYRRAVEDERDALRRLTDILRGGDDDRTP